MREFIKKVHSKKHISYPLYSLIGATLFVSAFFAFSSNALTSINLTAPMNNAYWNGTKNIAWTANCVSGDLVNIYYTTNNFDNTIKIGSNINCNAVSSFAWNTTTVADSNSAKVRVTDVTDPNINGSSGIFNVDNTIPTFTVNDSVAAGSVQTDTINITTADANGITSNAYGYSADATCNASDTYGTTFTSGTNFTIAGNHTDYLCVKTVDTATNIAYLNVGQLNTDNTGPTVALSYSPNNTVKDTDTLIVTATFNEALGGIPTIAIDTTGTDLTATPMTGSGTVWTYTYDVPSGSDGAATIAISVNDVAGNANSAATNATFTIDNTLPTFTINSGTDAGPVKTDVINISVGDTNNIPVKEYGYSADNICNGTDTYGNAFTSAVNFSITGDRTNYLCVKASDAAGNTAYQLVGQLNTDNTLPIVSSILSNTDPAKSGDTLTITFNVNEALAAHPTVTVAGNAATYSADNGTTYTYTYLVAGTEGTGEKTITVSATDVAGNVGTGSITNQTFDFTPPAITSLSTSKDPAKSGDVLSITFNASEPLSGNPTVTVAGNAATYSNLSGLTYTYTYTIAGTETEGDVTIAVNATDVVGNTGSASLTTQTLDYTQPGVTLTYSLNRAVRDADTMIITATFTEPVSASPTIAINTTGTNLSAVAMVASSGTVWTYSYNVPAGSSGTATAVIAATDLAGNANTVATSNTFVIDNIAPVAPTITSPLIATIINAANYSINGTAEADSLVKIYNTSSAVIGTQQLTGGATSFGISVSLAQNVANNFTVKATDVAGNEGVAGTVPTITADSIAPSVSISSLKTSPTNSSPFMITVSFSEAVTGFLIGDLAVSNGAASNLATADNITYTADITPTSDGPVTVNVNAAAAKDLANNDNLAATQFSINYDATPPTAIITASVASPTKITPFTTTITFSEPVSGFLIGGITVGNGTASNFIAASSTAYTASITPTADGAVTINVAGAKAQDLAGNNNTAATQVSIVFDGTPPSASQVLAVTNPTNDATPDITVNVEAGATFQILNGATVLGSTIGTGASQIITLTTLTEGVYNLTLVASDAVQNITTINLTQFAVDTTNPTMTITSTATSPTKLSPFMATFTFSEPVTGFAVGDIDVSNGAASNFVVASSTVYTAQITPTVDGVVAINVASAKAQDLAGNDNAVATQLSITSDRTPPTVLEVTPVTALANDITPDVVVNVEAGISFQIKNGATLVTSSTGIGASQTITLPTLANGIYNLTLTATDLAQNTTTINLTQFVVDSINPAVVVSDDQVDGTVRDADTVLITATFADASGIDEATVPKISIGSLVTNANMTKSSNLIWTYSWDVPTGNNGAQAVVITASDNANNPNSIATGVTTYAIDNTAPNISLSYSPNRNVADADTLVVTATFDETLSSAPLIAIDTTGTDLSSTAMTGGGSIWTYNYNVPAVSDGVATVSLSATDVAGNANNAPTNQTFAIDNLAPVITIATGTDPGPIQQDTINLTVADANTIATTTYGFSADAVCDQSDLYGNTFVSGTDFVIAGTHSDYLCAEAEDVAGNISYQLVGQLATDNAAPTLTYANISSNNAFTNLAKPTDTITLTIISDKNIANPTVMIAGSAADTVTQNGDAKHWLATSVMDSNDTEGSISFSVNFLDLAGNAGAQVVVATDASSVTFDKTAPNVTLSGTPQDPTSERDINILVGGANVTGYKYKLENGGYSAEISVATRLIRAELETVSHTLSVIGRDQAGNWQAAPTIYSWTISSGGGPMYFPPTPRATKYQVYSPATGKFIEVDIVYKDMPIVNTEPVSEKTQTHKMSADGTETFINRINTVVMGEIKSVEGSAKINIVDTPAMPQIIKFDAPTKSSVAGVSVELSKGVLFGLVNNYSADKDIKVDFAYDKAQPSQLNVGALGKGNSIVGNSVCSINMYSDTARISSFSNPLEIVFKTNNIVDKTGLTIASYNLASNKWVNEKTEIFGDQLIASVNHLTDFAIIRNVAVPDKVTEASKVDAAKTVSGECLLNNKIVSRLQEGSVNNQTKDVQELLKCLKYLPSDFKTSTTFAKTTTEGLKVFQKAKGVGPIGFFGTKTVNALNTYYKKTEVAKVEPKVTSKVTPKVTPKKKDDCGLDASLNTKLEKGASGEDVKKLQGLLQCLEYYPVNGKVTSYFGPTTTKALTAFQKAQGLTPNGSMSTQTKEALNKYKK